MTEEDIFPENPAEDRTFMGMTFHHDGTVGVPIEGIVLLKVMDDGEFGYRWMSTPGLNTVEGLGMLRWAQLMVEEGLRTFDDDDDEEEKEG